MIDGALPRLNRHQQVHLHLSKSRLLKNNLNITAFLRNFFGLLP
ncbi:hypothetical protein SynBIOSU31_00849 [Synechococcus sp. BIOS-U3-1]|nr:hypothetical protein SynBIOSU31_00849 [Synechococcus sp. BIOS-U3-1]